MRAPPSPCTGVCRIDPATSWCLGCRRTLDEIADWPMLSLREKHALLLRLAERAWRAMSASGRAGNPTRRLEFVRFKRNRAGAG